MPRSPHGCRRCERPIELKAGHSCARLAGVQHDRVNAATAELAFFETEYKRTERRCVSV
jgi:hypothetical protein